MERFETFFESFGFMRTRLMFHGAGFIPPRPLCPILAARHGATVLRDKSLSRDARASAARILPRRIQQRADRPQQRRGDYAAKITPTNQVSL